MQRFCRVLLHLPLQILNKRVTMRQWKEVEKVPHKPTLWGADWKRRKARLPGLLSFVVAQIKGGSAENGLFVKQHGADAAAVHEFFVDQAELHFR